MRRIKRVWYWACLVVATCFGLGLIPDRRLGKGGGMIGRVMAIVLMAVAWNDVSPTTMTWMILASTVLAAVVLPPAAKLMQELFGALPRHDGEDTTKDYNQFGIDEVPGQLIAFLPSYLAPAYSPARAILVVIGVIGFIIWDSKKLWPAKWAEDRLNFPANTIADDIAAGSMVCLITGTGYTIFQMLMT